MLQQRVFGVVIKRTQLDKSFPHLMFITQLHLVFSLSIVSQAILSSLFYVSYSTVAALLSASALLPLAFLLTSSLADAPSRTDLSRVQTLKGTHPQQRTTNTKCTKELSKRCEVSY